MTIFSRIAAGAALVALTCLPAFAADDITSQLEQIRAKHNLPALAAAVVKDGEIIASGATGTRVLGMDLPVTVEDRFHIGSDTKAMTATIAGTVVDEGLLRWDSTVGEVLGDTIKDMSPGLQAVTLAQLLSHSSGIPTDDAAMFDLYFNINAFDYNPAELRIRAIEAWKGHEPKVPEGSPFQYSNMGYLIAGAMVEKVTGKPWDVLIHERIFEPLGLKSAGLGPQATFGLYDAPVGHRVHEDGSITPMPWGAAADGPPMLGPAGIAHMSVLDFARWGGWNAMHGASPKIVERATLDEIQRVHVETPSMPNPPPGTPDQGGYALGWGVLNYDWVGHPVLTHNGSNSMNLAKIFADPETGIAIAAVTNFPGQAADEALGEVVEMLYRAQPQ